MPVLPLLGDHQKFNAALALATVETLQNKIPVSDAAIRTGLETVDWPGRLQLVTDADPAKTSCSMARTMWPARRLAASALEKTFPAGPQGSTLILGVLQDKDWRQICETLAPLAARIFTVPVASERTADARELAAACRAANPAAEIAACDSLRRALDQAASDRFRRRHRLALSGRRGAGIAWAFAGRPATSAALNEWSARPQPLCSNRIGRCQAYGTTMPPAAASVV